LEKEKEVVVEKESVKDNEDIKPVNTVIPVKSEQQPIDLKSKSINMVKSYGSMIFWITIGTLIFVISGTVAIFGLSMYYKKKINEMRQAPFSPPSWAPTWLFPRDYSFYYEYEISMSENNIRQYLDDEEIKA